MNSFVTFIPIPQSYNRLTPNQFAYTMWFCAMVALIMLVFVDNAGDVKFLKILFLGTFLYGTIVKLISLIADKGVRTITGKIIFENNRIIIDYVNYDLEDVDKIEFCDMGNSLRKFDGFSEHGQNWPNGKDVLIILQLKDSRKIRTYFQLAHRHEIRDIRPQLVHYHNIGKLHFLNLIDILGIEDYNAIQIFKKSLPEGGNIKSY